MFLKKLSEAPGVSGAETAVRDLIRWELKGIGEHKTDALGNLYVEKSKKWNDRIMLCAHMDEVGAMVKSVDSNGWLRFASVGGVDERILISKPVCVGPSKIHGVIGAKAIHLQEASERNKTISINNLYIDIGAKNKEDAEKHINIGDYVSFHSKFKYIDDDGIMGKAFDDRLGCYVISQVLKNHYNADIVGVFTVQEEVGLRGSAVAANRIRPDIAIVVEGTYASDVPGIEGEFHSTKMGKGPAITLMDRTFIANRKLVDRVVKVAEESNIPYQLRKTALGGTDAGRIHVSRSGIPTLVISIPCRYIHSPVGIANLNDIQNTISLLNALVIDLQERGVDCS